MLQHYTLTSIGFKGQARVIIPHINACFECAIEEFPPQEKYPVCTIANTPRLPEHCIEWASMIHWDERKPFGVDCDGNGIASWQFHRQFTASTAVKIDSDNHDHMVWLFNAAKERASQYNISGVTFKLTQGVIKNIIPAIASTNAIISGMDFEPQYLLTFGSCVCQWGF